VIIVNSVPPAKAGRNRLIDIVQAVRGTSHMWLAAGYYKVAGDRNKDFLELERGAGMRCSSVPQILPLKREKWNKMTIIPVGLYP
jgi:hypothetical protein